jgi:exonuclease III
MQSSVDGNQERDSAVNESFVTESKLRIKITTWNINGIRSICKTNIQPLLNLFPDTDILCIQETKLLSTIPSEICISDKYYSYFSICRSYDGTGRHKAYSGVATYVRKDIRTYKAQDGFCGSNDKESNILTYSDIREELGDLVSYEDAKAIDEEGRVIITGFIGSTKHMQHFLKCDIADHQLFVLINVYAPFACDVDSNRFDVKLKFNFLLKVFIEKLQSLRRNVVSLYFCAIIHSYKWIFEGIRRRHECLYI